MAFPILEVLDLTGFMRGTMQLTVAVMAPPVNLGFIYLKACGILKSTEIYLRLPSGQPECGNHRKICIRVFKQIRSMLTDNEPVGGNGKDVEVDEMYHGGRRKGRAGRPMRGDKNAVPVVGMVERHGRVIALAIPDVTARSLVGSVKRFVFPTTTVFTDEFASYNTVSEGRRYEHYRIKHSENVYVVGDVHTNTVEGFWSLIKRGIGGVFHSVRSEYLQSYLNECSFRYKRLFDMQPMFTSFLYQISKAKPSESPLEDQARNPAA